MITMNDVLKLFKGYFISFDNTKYMIDFIQKENEIIAENINFTDCMKLIYKNHIVETEGFKIDDLDFFMTNPYIQGSFLFPFEKEDKTIQYYRIVKKIEKGKTLIYFEEFNDKNSLSTLTDPLTDVYQRTVFEQFINNKIGINKDRKFYMMVVDIDNFKNYNDQYGHLVGDEVLKEIAKVFKTYYKNGFIGRIGGDEFVIADFDDLTKDQIKEKCNKLLEEVNKIVVPNLNSKDPISITIGISFYPEFKDYRSLFAQADKNLYKGKYTGKNKFVL